MPDVEKPYLIFLCSRQFVISGRRFNFSMPALSGFYCLAESLSVHFLPLCLIGSLLAGIETAEFFNAFPVDFSIIINTLSGDHQGDAFGWE